MLKIMKYDIKSVIIAPVFIILVYTIMAIIQINTINNYIENIISGATKKNDIITMVNALSEIFYAMILVVVVAVMWRKSSMDIELYEMAGVSPLKVGLTRMFTIMIIMTIVSSIFIIINLIVTKHIDKVNLDILNLRMEADRHFFSINEINIFDLYGNKWSNIFVPLFMGLLPSILFTPSFLFATVTRRIDNKFIIMMIFGGMVILLFILYYDVLLKLNLYLPELDLNKYGLNQYFIDRLGPAGGLYYESDSYIFCPNFLHVGYTLFQIVFVSLMFSIYSLRRKAI